MICENTTLKHYSWEYIPLQSHHLICLHLLLQHFKPNSFFSRFVAAAFREIWAKGLYGLKKNKFFRGFTQFFVPFCASRPSLCTWLGHFEKKSDLACFLWQYTPLKQKSATPQGLPPPTQQINIQMQISWVGRSTTSSSSCSQQELLYSALYSTTYCTHCIVLHCKLQTLYIMHTSQ